MNKLLTLVIVHQGDKILLGMKKRGFGVNRWNGFGGKVTEGESIEQGAKRELVEEAGIEPLDMDKRGIIEFHFPGESPVLEVHLFKITRFNGEPLESEEMKPQWFSVNEIPFDKMWSDDIYWMQMFLQGQKFKATFNFDENDQVIEHKLEVVSVL